ncbi:hypothetical protein Q5P01_016683 [Channa striata]|uniref:Uncharacterized protein n=1 Tax=Channa striata TaxID=64152 RepID=A0AA88M806_CHASR|nr:hypothetical protein Q5P01_016683 [Channa striata]
MKKKSKSSFFHHSQGGTIFEMPPHSSFPVHHFHPSALSSSVRIMFYFHLSCVGF